MTGLWLVTYIVLWVLVLAQLLIIYALAKQIGLLLERRGVVGARMTNQGLDLNDRAPEFHVLDLHGKMVGLGVEQNKQTLLIFVSPGCSVCELIMPGIRTIQKHERNFTDVVVVSFSGTEEDNRKYAREYRLAGVPYVLSSDLSDTYQVHTAPYAVLVGQNGVIRAKGLVNGLEHLESLLNTTDEGHESFDSKMRSESAQASENDLSTMSTATTTHADAIGGLQ